MTRWKLLIVTPRFWPLVDDTAQLVATLADAFCLRDISTTILTAKWDAEWPDTLVHRQAPVERLPHSPHGGWSTFRYMRSLSRWLRQHGESFDLVYVMNLRQDAYAAVGALKNSGTPILLRARRAGDTGDCHWQRTARLGRRIQKRCQMADMVVASSQVAVRELLAAGYAEVVCIRNAAAPVEPRSAAGRFRSRVALADANYDLAVAEYAPVAICVERMDDDRGLGDLIKAWSPIASRWPSAKLWLVGDGPLREPLYEGIVQRGLHHQICMPGSFDDLTELLQAADLFISAAPGFGSTQALVEALAAGLPVIAMDTPDVREIIEHEVEGYLLPPGQPKTLSHAIARLFETPALGGALSTAARRRASQDCCLEHAVDQHLELFQQLVAKHESGTP